MPIPARKLLRLRRTPFVLLRSDHAETDFEADFAPKSETEESLRKIRKKRFVEITADIHPNAIEAFDQTAETGNAKRSYKMKSKTLRREKYR